MKVSDRLFNFAAPQPASEPIATFDRPTSQGKSIQEHCGAAIFL